MTKMHLLSCCLFSVAILLFAAGNSAQAEIVSDEAKRHFDYGMAAVEMANSPDDYESAIKEFGQAARLAPGWPDVYYNLGMVLEKSGDYDGAIQNLKQYLRLAPNESDAETIKRLINKLEYKKKKTEEEANITSLLRGKWLGNPGPNNWIGWPVQFLIEGDLLYFYAQTGMDVDKSTLSAPVFYNYQKVLVTRKEKDIYFRVRLETLLDGGGRKWTRDAQYNLKLLGHGKLEGTVNFDGKTRAAYFWRE